MIHKDKIAISGEQESYVFVGITSTESYLWTQDAKRRQFLGPTVLDIGIPFSQPGKLPSKHFLIRFACFNPLITELCAQIYLQRELVTS